MAFKKDPEIEAMNKEIAQGSKPEMGISAFDGGPLPDFMRQYGRGVGTEEIRSDATSVPRLVLMQTQSPLIESGDARPGDWYHLTGDEAIGKEVLFVPCWSYVSSLLFDPMDRKVVLARTKWEQRPDGRKVEVWSPANTEFKVTLPSGKQVAYHTGTSVDQSRLLEWGTADPDDPKSQPAGTKFINVVAYLPERPELSPVIIGFARTSFKIGQKLMSQLKLVDGPSFGCVFKLYSERLEAKQGGSYLIYRFQAKGVIKDPVLFETCRNVYEAFKGKDIAVVGEGAEETTDEAAPY